MDAYVEDVIRHLGVMLPDGWSLAGSDPAQGWLEIANGDCLYRLVLDEPELARGLKGITQHQDFLWGAEVGPVETLARLMSIHLEESLMTKSAEPGASWTYHDGFFYPVDPGNPGHQ